jgi:hypothetical protein
MQMIAPACVRALTPAKSGVRPSAAIRANRAPRIPPAVVAFLIFWGKLYYPFGDLQRRR